MDQAVSELQKKLIACANRQDGPMQLLRRAVKARRERPALDWPELLSPLLTDVSTEEGASAMASLRARKIKWLTVLDEAYPLMLRHIADPPLALFYAGAAQALHRPCVSVVGSRSCTAYGQQVAKKIAGDLARLGFVIVSGLAYGIDARAHEAALAAGGRAAAALGSGVDRIYPRVHRPLAREIIARGGVVISEFAPGSPPKPFHFPVRNRLISGLCHAVIVVEAKEKSGSLITARHCLEQGRELFAVPGPIHHATSVGVNRLIEKGEARAYLSVESVLEQLAPLVGMAADHAQAVRSRIADPLARRIYEKLDAFEPAPLDLLVSELGEEPGPVLAKLVELETDRLVERLPGQLFVRNPLRTPPE